jgi:hypothetical protein
MPSSGYSNPRREELEIEGSALFQNADNLFPVEMVLRPNLL